MLIHQANCWSSHGVSDIEIDRPRFTAALITFSFVNYELINFKFSEHLLYCILYKFGKKLSSFTKN